MNSVKTFAVMKRTLIRPENVDIVPVNIYNTVMVSVFCGVVGLCFFVTIWISV